MVKLTDKDYIKNILENNMKTCPFCGSDEYSDIRKVNVYNYILCNLPVKEEPVQMKIYTCKHCGLGIYHDYLSDDELENIYKHYFYPFHYFDNPDISWYNDFDVDFISKHIQTEDSKIVELGCHDGFFMDLLQKHASLQGKHYKNLLGIEPSPNADIGIAHGLKIEKKFFKEHYFPDNEKVDLFYSSHVFEHIKDSFTLFNNMLSQLNKNGKIIIIVPNFSGYDITHYYYYSWPFFEKMAEKYGAKIIDAKITYSSLRQIEELKIVFSKKNAEYDEVKCPFDMHFIIKHEKEMQDKLVSEFLDGFQLIKKFVENKEVVYWYGTASYYLVSYCGLLSKRKVKYNIIPVDNEQNRQGFKIPNCSTPVELLQNFSNQVLDNMIISEMDREIVMSLLKKYNIKINNILYSKF